MNNLLWYVFIKPYISQNGEWIPNTGSVLGASSCPPTATSNNCSHTSLAGGAPWMQYDDPKNGNSSYEVISELATEIMETYGYKLEYIRILAEMNKSALITP